MLELLAGSRDPITLYIDSFGGSVFHGDAIYSLIKSTDQDGAPPCHLITVVTTRAMSAAADLLSAGDYALAYPNSVMLHHGTRRLQDRAITQETATGMAEGLKRTNERYATRLATRCIERFIFRYVLLSGSTPEESADDPEMSPRQLVQKFLKILSEKASPDAQGILDQANQRYEQSANLFDIVSVKLDLEPFTGDLTLAQIEAAMLHALIDHEVASNDDGSNEWTFRENGFLKLQQDFSLLLSYINRQSDDYVRLLNARWGFFLLSPANRKLFEAIPDDQREAWKFDRTRDLFREIGSLFVSLCRVLQGGENILDSTDCYWLGLIDEVID